MAEQPEPRVGERIRALREQQGLSLRALSGQCGLSVNAISRIERGENSPTVASLRLLASALGVSITAFFEDERSQATVFVPRERRLRAEGVGVVMESLGIGLPGQQIEPFLVTAAPGAGSSADPVTHSGEEFVHCLAGQVEYQVGDTAYHLGPGDSLIFEAEQPHCFRTSGETPATLLLVFQAAGGAQVAHRHHLRG